MRRTETGVAQGGWPAAIYLPTNETTRVDLVEPRLGCEQAWARKARFPKLPSIDLPFHERPPASSIEAFALQDGLTIITRIHTSRAPILRFA